VPRVFGENGIIDRFIGAFNEGAGRKRKSGFVRSIISNKWAKRKRSLQGEEREGGRGIVCVVHLFSTLPALMMMIDRD